MKLIENLSLLPLKSHLNKQREWEIFICCGGFEKRCVRSTDILLDKQVKIGTTILFNYKEIDPGNKKDENIKKMKDNLKQISSHFHIFNTESVYLPYEGLKKFLIFIKEKNIDLSDRKIIFDITVFAKAYFFLLFKILIDKFNLRQFHVIYTEPEKYKSKNPVTNDIILTDGLDRIGSIPGFSGSSVNSRDALIVILGFEGKRSIEAFNNINPELTYAINGFPSYRSGWHRISIEENLRFLKESLAFNHLFSSPALNPFETKEIVAKIVKEITENNKDINIIITPLGTKMQAFGVLLYALKNNRLKVIYPFPSSYKPDYSYEYGPTWIFKVDLDKL